MISEDESRLEETNGRISSIAPPPITLDVAVIAPSSRSRSAEACKCKVGKCHKCTSKCKRCGCSCDGKTVEEKLARKAGQRGKGKNNAEKRKKRSAAAAFANENVEANPEEQPTLSIGTEAIKPLASSNATWEDVSKCLRMDSKSLQKILPTKRQAIGEEPLRPQTLSGIVSLAEEAARSVIRILAPGHMLEISRSVGNKLGSVDDKLGQKLQKNCVALLHSAPQGSIQARVVRSILTKSLTSTQIRTLKAELLEEGEENTLSLYPDGNKRSAAIADFEEMKKGVKLEQPTRSRQKFLPDVVNRALKCALASESVGILSLQSRPVVLGEDDSGNAEIVLLPSLTRRMHFVDLYSTYTATNKAASTRNELVGEPTADGNKRKVVENRDMISDNSFRKLFNAISSGGLRLLFASDYIVGRLVNDPAETLRRIVSDIAVDVKKETILQYLEDVKHFLKYGYKQYFRNGMCSFHCPSIMLDKEVELDGSSNACTACAAMATLQSMIQQVVEERGDPALVLNKDVTLGVVHSMINKFELYLVHCQSKFNQQRLVEAQLSKLENYTRTTKNKSSGFVIMDWNLKWEPANPKETPMEYYGRRGIGWHGFLVHFYEWVDEDGGAAVRRTLFFDQIMESSNHQDCFAVASMLESFLWQLSHEMPWLREVVLQSDNASCYQSQQLLALIPLFNTRYAVKVTRFIHCDGEDGEYLLRTHFARCSSHVETTRKLETSNDEPLSSAQSLAAALASRGGVHGSVVQLVRMNPKRMEELNASLKPLVEEMSVFFSSYSAAEFMLPEDGWEQAGLASNCERFSLESLKDVTIDFKIRIWPFSAAGSGVLFSLNWSQRNSIDGVENMGRFGAVEPCPVSYFEIGVEFEEDDCAEGEELPTTDTGKTESPEEVMIADFSDDLFSQRFSLITDKSQAENSVTGAALVRRGFLSDISLRKWRRREQEETKIVCERRDMEAYVLRESERLLAPSEQIPSSLQVHNQPFSNPQQTGSATRTVAAAPYGVSYLHKYREEISTLFELGRGDPSKQKNAFMMVQHFHEKYPFVYDIPGEIEIRKELRSLHALRVLEATERRKALALEDLNKFERFRWPQAYTEKLEGMVCDEELKNKKLAELAAEFLESVRLPDGRLPPDLPAEGINLKTGKPTTQLEKVKMKISSIKAALAKRDQ